MILCSQLPIMSVSNFVVNLNPASPTLSCRRMRISFPTPVMRVLWLGTTMPCVSLPDPIPPWVQEGVVVSLTLSGQKKAPSNSLKAPSSNSPLLVKTYSWSCR